MTVLGAGVTGTPFTGWSSHDSASTVDYEFSVKTEFSNLRVWLDDELTAPSGFVLMDGDHTLIALADTVFAFSAGDSVVLNSIRSLVSSTDPLASVQLLVTGALEDIASGGRSQQELSALASNAFDPLAEGDLVLSLMDQLGGQIITVTPPEGAGFRAGTHAGPDQGILGQGCPYPRAPPRQPGPTCQVRF